MEIAWTTTGSNCRFCCNPCITGGFIFEHESGVLFNTTKTTLILSLKQNIVCDNCSKLLGINTIQLCNNMGSYFGPFYVYSPKGPSVKISQLVEKNPQAMFWSRLSIRQVKWLIKLVGETDSEDCGVSAEEYDKALKFLYHISNMPKVIMNIVCEYTPLGYGSMCFQQMIKNKGT